MPDELDDLKRLEAWAEDLLKSIRIKIEKRENTDADEEAQRRRRRFHVIAVIPLAATATTAAIRRNPGLAAAITTTATAAAATAVILLPHFDSNDTPGGNAPRVITPAPTRPSPAPRRTKKPGTAPTVPGVPSPPAPSTFPAETTRIVPLVGSITSSPPPVSLPISPQPSTLPRPAITITGAPPATRPNCLVDVRKPVALRVCPRRS
ncbi:hypothetical protein GCM10023196_036200 [Actinoallomurus vinaceus]|uniref:Uncharacterized protein n=1 Tax=Actinoallomurus vinaceus TaxID=1080074 RepID=A0ABP8UBR8_9ACTN